MALTSYTALPNSAVQAGGRPRGTTVTALRDNPIAIAEGDSTAIVNQGNWHPYNKVTNGDANTGVFYDFAVDGAVAQRVTPTFADGYEYRVEWYGISHNSGSNQDFQVEFFRETNAAYNPALSLVSANPASALLTGEIGLPRVRRNMQFQACPFWIASTVANATSSQNGTTITNSMSTAQKVTRLRFSWTAGSIDAGTMILFRRRLIF